MTSCWSRSCFYLLCVLQARFSDTEDECSSRMPVSRQLSADAKQVRRSSQRSKVKGYNTGESERSGHNLSDPGIRLISHITVSVVAWIMSTKCHLHTLMCTSASQTEDKSETLLTFSLKVSERCRDAETGCYTELSFHFHISFWCKLLLLFWLYVKADSNFLLPATSGEVMLFWGLSKSIHSVFISGGLWYITSWGHGGWNP